MPEKPMVFISCGQYTPEEKALGNEVEQLIRNETGFEPYFAEQRNTLKGLVTDILSALGRASAFIGIMHKRGSIKTPSGTDVVRGSVWVEQEVAIASFIEHVLNRRIEVVLYLQRGISREGIRSQLLLKPIEFDSHKDVISDLKARLESWNLSPISTAPLIAQWQWNLQPGSNAGYHQYNFSVELYNNGPSLIEKWKVEVWFPPNFVKDRDFEYSTTSDIDFSFERKRIWPNTNLPVLTIPYFVNDSNWPGWIEGKVPTVKIKISTENAPPWEEEISMKDIQKF